MVTPIQYSLELFLWVPDITIMISTSITVTETEYAPDMVIVTTAMLITGTVTPTIITDTTGAIGI